MCSHAATNYRSAYGVRIAPTGPLVIERPKSRRELYDIREKTLPEHAKNPDLGDDAASNPGDVGPGSGGGGMPGLRPRPVRRPRNGIGRLNRNDGGNDNSNGINGDRGINGDGRNGGNPNNNAFSLPRILHQSWNSMKDAFSPTRRGTSSPPPPIMRYVPRRGF